MPTPTIVAEPQVIPVPLPWLRWTFQAATFLLELLINGLSIVSFPPDLLKMSWLTYILTCSRSMNLRKKVLVMNTSSQFPSTLYLYKPVVAKKQVQKYVSLEATSSTRSFARSHPTICERWPTNPPQKHSHELKL